MRKVKYAGIQMQCTKSVEENIAKADKMVRKAASEGAKIILLPELFERQYFCQERNYDYYLYARSLEEDEAVNHFKKRLQLSMQTGVFLEFTEKHIFRMTIIIRKSFILHREIQDLRCGIQDMVK